MSISPRTRVKDSAATAGGTVRAPRERILDAARNLFYKKGIRAVSVDEIAAEAATNKMTLYRHFASKDLLVAEYLRTLAAQADSVWARLAAAHPGDTEAQLRAWVGQVAEVLSKGGERGCALANAAVELPEKHHPARAVIEQHKTHQREKLVQLCTEAGFLEPERIADEIFLILEGARVNIQSVGTCGPGSRFAAMVCALMTGHAKRKR